MDSKMYEDALHYHKQLPSGKMEMMLSKSLASQQDITLAYSPGVAAPCIEIEKNKDNAYHYTWKGNTIAVISDGTAVLGLGDIGPDAALPVMEGKAMLFRQFAHINALPLCIKPPYKDGKYDIDQCVQIIRSLAPSLGGMNLEDIAAPHCFEIEARLKAELSIPVFHDDQHGTAVIVLAALENACIYTKRSKSTTKIVINGAGAAGIAIYDMLVLDGFKPHNILVCDSHGVICHGREVGMNLSKQRVAKDTSARTLPEALQGVDVFIGVSKGNILTQEMIQSMAQDPLIFALANPIPEIDPELAQAAGAAIICTGRGDFPNQVNNVLGFPGIFRGALDVRAREITDVMKLAASKAIATIAREPMSFDIQILLSAYYPQDADRGMFDGSGLRYDAIIPKPIDPRVVPKVARAVAEAALNEGIGVKNIPDFDLYERELFLSLSLSQYN